MMRMISSPSRDQCSTQRTARSSCEKRAGCLSLDQAACDAAETAASKHLRLRGRERPQVGGHLLRREGFDEVAFLEVAESAQADAALHSVGYFADIVLEALKRADLALVHLLVSAHHFDLRVAADDSVLNAAAGDGTHLGNAEDIDDFRAAHIVFLELRFQQAQHG